MKLYVGKRPIRLPGRPCMAEDVRAAVDRANVPFVVRTDSGGFSARRRVFLSAEGVRVECENEQELQLACRLLSEGHNQWQTPDEAWRCIDETARMERAIEESPAAPSEDECPTEDEDITIEEWGQMGYKWFKREDVLYI
jgi:hypothetical protein